jgi:hypothetical protein
MDLPHGFLLTKFYLTTITPKCLICEQERTTESLVLNVRTEIYNSCSKAISCKINSYTIAVA